MGTTRRQALAGAAGLALALRTDSATAATLTVAPGAPRFAHGDFDLAAFGYVMEEHFLAGTATSYRHVGEPGPDGAWRGEPAATAPYVSRIVVIRPTDPRRFNGSAVVEWFNVSGGTDAGPDWIYLHREILRGGYAYVGVSAQRVGIEGGPSLNPASTPLKKLDPARYGALSHPGDAFSFDIFSQAGQAVRDGRALGPLKARRVLAIGESQSAIFLTTYVNAVDPLAKVYDGYLVHSRFGGAPRLEGSSIFEQGGPPAPTGVKFRPDLRVPVLTFITETDLIGSGLSGYWTARQPDGPRLRAWEVAGAAHADNYVFNIGRMDSGALPIEKLAAAWKPTADMFGLKFAKPMNAAPQHHYVVMAALNRLDQWVRTGRAPATAQRLEITPPAGPGASPTLVLDETGNARGGVRTPWVDAPTARHSGLGNSGNPLAFLVGVSDPYDAATLARLYPGGRAEYLRRHGAALDRAVKGGFILEADAPEIRQLAAAGWPAG